ncbi:hypothetical protein BJ138DRAFT_1107013 [Hygrophoropsis aurantiaca]|uniref:Uncharacterized protein n=1 Tax=Hygrophoropsis aurantiaca TaxID=72124 RepID=A0ACB7ZT10_9AGAM|nr:hypothetical protein BJ138DRAFT_1107013 [Hygrophoropsis aurantiaca]
MNLVTPYPHEPKVELVQYRMKEWNLGDVGGNLGGVEWESEWESKRCGMGIRDVWSGNGNGNTGEVEWNLGGVEWESRMRGMGIQDVWSGIWCQNIQTWVLHPTPGLYIVHPVL